MLRMNGVEKLPKASTPDFVFEITLDICASTMSQWVNTI